LRNGAVDIDGFDSIAKHRSVVMSVRSDTMVVVYGDGPDVIYAGKVHDLLVMRRGTPLRESERAEKFSIVKPAPPRDK
jgi:hypothetical protein